MTDVVDSSVVVAGLSPWHECHESARAALDNHPGIVGHALVEAFSVLTRLPAPFRMPAALAAELLSTNFPAPPLVLTAEQLQRFIVDLPGREIRGGAVFDAVIATTTREAGARLLTLDVRAARTYRAVQADTRIL